MKKPAIFHLAIPINDIAKAKSFYTSLGCEIGRENPHAIILDFYGHQVVCHMTKDELAPQKGIYPRHFGLVFHEESDWENIFARAQEHNLSFCQESKVRFPGKITEHRTFFLEDPFYNLLEFKFYRNFEAIFGAREIVEIGDRT